MIRKYAYMYLQAVLPTLLMFFHFYGRYLVVCTTVVVTQKRRLKDIFLPHQPTNLKTRCLYNVMCTTAAMTKNTMS